MAELWKGAPVAEALTNDLISRTAALKEKGVTPCLAILRVGENESDLAYERGAEKRCGKIGIEVKKVLLPADCSQEDLMSAIDGINADETVHGCLMFRPLPKHLDETAACERLDASKDVDCITSGSLIRVFTGKGAGYAPCTAEACMEILAHYGVDLTGKRVTVIGRSLVIGKPVSMLLQAANATVTMCHTRTVDLPGVCKEGEILVVAAGKAGVVDDRFTHPDQIIIDVGINVNEEGKLCGDVDLAKVEPACRAVTPTPGGVGTVTSSVLAKHVVMAAEAAAEA